MKLDKNEPEMNLLTHHHTARRIDHQMRKQKKRKKKQKIETRSEVMFINFFS